jgi:membrane protein implicated in regulation of membrane protease activity
MKPKCVVKTAGMMIGSLLAFSAVFAVIGTACVIVSQWIVKTVYGTSVQDNFLIFTIISLVLIVISMSFVFALFCCYIDDRNKKKKEKLEREKISIDVG